MATRRRKPAVPPGLRSQWLAKYEYQGEPIADIAEAAGYDRRTVTKEIEKAQEDRERKEARSVVLRQAMERHYQDLCNLAERLDAIVAGSGIGMSDLKNEPLWRALREHLPRAVLWKKLDSWEKALKDLSDIDSTIQAQARAMVEESAFGYSEVPDAVGFGPGLLQAVSRQSEASERGKKGLTLEADFRIGRAGEGRHTLQLGPFSVGIATAEHLEAARTLLQRVMSGVPAWVDYYEVSRHTEELRRARERVQDDLLEITLKRVVSGRCRYCP
jgi:hypothetical protein